MDINPPPAQGNNFLSNTDSHQRPRILSRAIATVAIDHRIEERCTEPGQPGYWSSSNPDLLIPFQPATATYLNSFGQIVIRQEDQFGDEDDVIFISRENLPALIRRLQQFSCPSANESAEAIDGETN